MTTDEQINDFEKGLPDLSPTPEPIEPLEEIPKYRFKTEQEFIEEFGKEWRNQLAKNKYPNMWVASMDYLFGEVLEPIIAETYYKFPSSDISIDGWAIDKKMITDKPLK